MQDLVDYLESSEMRLMERILAYAKDRGYAAYTSTLLEAWRASISGLTKAIVAAVDVYGESIPEFTPGKEAEEDAVTAFGIHEAQVHRERGIDLGMFLGLYKYYRYAYVDILNEMDAEPDRIRRYVAYVERVIDSIEIAFCAQWANLSDNQALKDLQESNRGMTNKKNKYLTLFESLDRPAFLLDDDGRIDNLNPKAA